MGLELSEKQKKREINHLQVQILKAAILYYQENAHNVVGVDWHVSTTLPIYLKVRECTQHPDHFKVFTLHCMIK